MRLKPGKICNSLKSISPTACLQRLCSCCCICASRSSMSSNSGGTNKPTLKKELKLIYYTFLYNHHNDSLTALETVLYPLVDMMTSFVKILGWVLDWDLFWDLFLFLLVLILTSFSFHLSGCFSSICSTFSSRLSYQRSIIPRVVGHFSCISF